MPTSGGSRAPLKIEDGRLYIDEKGSIVQAKRMAAPLYGERRMDAWMCRVLFDNERKRYFYHVNKTDYWYEDGEAITGPRNLVREIKP